MVWGEGEGGIGVREGGVGISNVGGESMGVETTNGKLQLREDVQVTDSELSFEDESDSETPQKKRKLDPEFLLETR